MLPKSELEIVNLFLKNPLQGRTIRSISLSLSKPYPHIHSHIQLLFEKGILIKRSVGASHLCFANLSSEAGRIALSMASLDKLKSIPDILAKKLSGAAPELDAAANSSSLLSPSPLVAIFQKKVFIVAQPHSPGSPPFQRHASSASKSSSWPEPGLELLRSSLQDIVSSCASRSGLVSQDSSHPVHLVSPDEFFPAVISHFASSAAASGVLSGRPSKKSQTSGKNRHTDTLSAGEPIIVLGHYSYISQLANRVVASLYGFPFAAREQELVPHSVRKKSAERRVVEVKKQ
ncbi:hypothetical protein D6764_03780 [Candidatus Woesearchaeota archaeon]|nr:MAG: hypothetical protein D6764_03780 [Candidatus Woesearchaeota archaeon]